MSVKSERKKRKEEQILFSHHLAEEIADFAKDYDEVAQITERVKNEFNQVARKRKPKIKKQVTDDWGNPIGAETQ